MRFVKFNRHTITAEKTADLVTFIEEILYWKTSLLCS